jgi:hypothetical protein
MNATEFLKGGKAILTPFTLDAVLLYHKLKNSGIEVECFFDRNPLMQNKKYDGTLILRATYHAGAKVIVCSEPHGKALIQTLRACNYPDCDIMKNDVQCCEGEGHMSDYAVVDDVNLREFAALVPFQANAGAIMRVKKMRVLNRFPSQVRIDDARFEGYFREESFRCDGETHIILKRIELNVTSRCTNRCKHCGALMQYYKDAKDMDIEVVKRDFDRMLSIIDFTDDILIMGGEPLIHRELAELLRHIGNNQNSFKKIGYIRLVSNGTILPDDELIDALKFADCYVWISNYGHTNQKIQELSALFADNGINYEILDTYTWAYVQQVAANPQEITEDDLLMRSKKEWKRHRALRAGRLYMCAFLDNGDALGLYPKDEKNYVDIYVDDVKEQIAQYLSSDNPLPPGCAYCNGNFPDRWEKQAQIPAAEQTSAPLAYKSFGR